MNTRNAMTHLVVRYATLALALGIPSVGAWAQDATTVSIEHGTPTYTTEGKNAEIVYVQDNNLVLKLENGKVEHLVVPDSDRFTIGDKQVTVRELKPGGKLTQTITTTTTPRYVKTVRTVKGKIWHAVSTGRVIVAMPDGTHQIYNIPSHAKVKINGQPASSTSLRKGMAFEATIVTDSSETVLERGKLAVAEEPVPATPALLGFLVIQQPEDWVAPASAPEEVASTGEVAPTLPKTASPQPLLALMGGIGLASALGLGFVRRRFNV